MDMIKIPTISGGTDGFNSLLYKPPTQKLVNYLQTNLSSAMQRLSGLGAAVTTNMQFMFDKYNSDAAINRSIMLANESNAAVTHDIIRILDRRVIHTATPVMRTFMMANPRVFNLNRQQRCEGYDGEYFQFESGARTVEELPEYQLVMDGVYDEESDITVFYHNEYMEDFELRSTEKSYILETWGHANNMISEGLDPTSEVEFTEL